MSRIVWLASYPKSGNTWLRFVVTAILSGRDEFPAEHQSMYADIEEFTPDIYYPEFDLARYADRPRVFLKTHDALNGGEPSSRARWTMSADSAPTDRAVYLVRNPLDILTSTWNHLRIEDIERAPSFEDFFAAFNRDGGYQQWTSIYGRWDENVDSWTRKPTAFPLLVLRYEDLVADPLKHFQRAAEFLEIDSRAERLRAAIEQFSFARLRQREDTMVQRGVRAGKGAQEGHRFFNVGRSGHHASALNPQQIQLVRSRFAAPMERFGY